MATSQEVAVRSSANMAALAELEAILLDDSDQVVEVVEDPEDIQREILAQLLAAESDDELESFGEAIGWRTIARRYVEHDGLPIQPGVPVEVSGFSWRPSEYGTGPAVFFIVRGKRMDTGDRVVLTTGSANILAMLVNRAKRGALPAILLATEGQEATKKNKTWPLWIVRPPEAAAPKG